ncbi:hypothetical protein EVAR_43605_1 [Eumeta japonica]|uniref:Uncharacterized protein n=1 Tax=Eumeta variegata TaxID=151549 RepID=A0A4C1XHH7_EUMVA|nr:hypothetical protein EVAR_43605_1 [Eumeta japonica]
MFALMQLSSVPESYKGSILPSFGVIFTNVRSVLDWRKGSSDVECRSLKLVSFRQPSKGKYRKGLTEKRYCSKLLLYAGLLFAIT